MRLTYKALDQHGKETGTVWYASTAGNSIFPKSDREEQVLKKLAAYEDTGLTPEEFKESADFVLELNKKLKPYMDAEEHGRLVILPCKIGDKVFRVVSKCPGAIQCPFEGGHGLDRCNNCDAFIKEESFCLFMLEDIGKTVFLTREEAEVALEGEK